MACLFFECTAEDLIASVEAVVVSSKAATPEFVSEFTDVPLIRATSALKLAVEMGFLKENAGKFVVASPLSGLLVTPNLKQKAAALRVVLETYEPFVVFRQRLKATDYPHQAAQQTKAQLNIVEHKNVVKETLISLGTYSRALANEGGGVYVPADDALENHLLAIAQSCQEIAAAEARVRLQMGEVAAGTVSRDEVLVPLANALLKAAAGDANGAVTQAGNAVESYLEKLAGRTGVNLAGAPGLNAKLDKFSMAGKLPKKLIAVGKYLGNVRNAADHGIDAEINAVWTIQETTGLEFVYVTCSFICAATAIEKAHPQRI